MKKFLSLVLALVMTMSLVTVSAGAKDFSDDDSITYQEAVDVISEIGVVDGYPGGDFKPTDVLTRGAAAKIICNLILGPTTASALSASSAPFKDVPVSNTFAGYITYCAQEKIINGYSDGTFRPTATLSGNAFMKMLLGALGYDSSVEGYTGSNWSVAVIKQAVGIGLDDGNDVFVGSKAVTREEAALYAFNMLQATMVEYDAKTSVDINGATVTIAGDKAKEVENTSRTDGYIDDDNKMQFAERYFTDLRLTTDTTDDFGRPANTWRFKGVEVGTFAKTADATYTADVKLGQIYSDLGMSDKDERAEVYVDGVQANEFAKVSKGNDLKVSELDFNGTRDCNVGNGTLVEAYLDENTNDVTIVAINTFAAEVNKVVAATNSKEAYITLSELPAENGISSGVRANDEFETTGFENDQIVLFTYANNEIQSVKAAESVEGTLAKKVLTKSIDLGETTYKFANAYAVDGGESSLGVNSEYAVYLDEYGYAIYVEETEYNIADYAYLRALQSGNTVFQSDKASLLTYDGKTKTVNTTEDYVGDISGYADKASVAIGSGKIVLARENSSGEYRLKELASKNFTDSASQFEMKNGVAEIELTASSSIYADSKTVVVVGTHPGTGTGVKTTYRAYTGANNMPDIENKGSSNDLAMTYYCRSGNVATIIFIDVDTTKYTVTAGNNDVIFFSVESGSKWTENADNSYYSYTAVVNGKIVENVMVADDVTIENASGVAVAGSGDGKFTYSSPNIVFTGADYDDGIITSLDTIAGSGTVQGVNKLSNENVQLGYADIDGDGDKEYGSAGTFVVADDVKVFFLDDDGVITEGTINNVRRSTDDIVTYVLDQGQISYLFVQQYFEDNDQSSGIGRGGLDLTSMIYNNSLATKAFVLSYQSKAALAGTEAYSVTITDVDGYTVTSTSGTSLGTPVAANTTATLNVPYTAVSGVGTYKVTLTIGNYSVTETMVVR